MDEQLLLRQQAKIMKKRAKAYLRGKISNFLDNTIEVDQKLVRGMKISDLVKIFKRENPNFTNDAQLGDMLYSQLKERGIMKLKRGYYTFKLKEPDVIHEESINLNMNDEINQSEISQDDIHYNEDITSISLNVNDDISEGVKIEFDQNEFPETSLFESSKRKMDDVSYGEVVMWSINAAKRIRTQEAEIDQLVSGNEELKLRNEELQSTITKLEKQNEILEEQIKRISMEWQTIFLNFDEEVDFNGIEYHRYWVNS